MRKEFLSGIESYIYVLFAALYMKLPFPALMPNIAGLANRLTHKLYNKDFDCAYLMPSLLLVHSPLPLSSGRCVLQQQDAAADDAQITTSASVVVNSSITATSSSVAAGVCPEAEVNDLIYFAVYTQAHRELTTQLITMRCVGVRLFGEVSYVNEAYRSVEQALTPSMIHSSVAAVAADELSHLWVGRNNSQDVEDEESQPIRHNTDSSSSHTDTVHVM
jgi:hypothetical protein